MPAESSFSVGAVLASRYEIVDYVGKGGMGLVYKAHDRTLDELVAIKVLRPQLVDDPLMAQRLLAEIKLARRVTHKNVCRIHDYGQDGAVRFISMQFIDGIELKKLVRERRGLPADEAYEIALQLADALDAIHEEGIIHRDFKTANVMLDRRGASRLMDFGIAKLWESEGGEGLTSQGLAIGTPEYMSPEQALAQPLDPRSDIYSMGVVLFELFTGAVPFTAANMAGLVYQKLHEAPPLDSPAAATIPAPVKSIIHKTLAPAPADRYSSTRELRAALLDARGQTPMAATDATTTTLVARVQQLCEAAPAISDAGAPRAAAVPRDAAGAPEEEPSAARKGQRVARFARIRIPHLLAAAGLTLAAALVVSALVRTAASYRNSSVIDPPFSPDLSTSAPTPATPTPSQRETSTPQPGSTRDFSSPTPSRAHAVSPSATAAMPAAATAAATLAACNSGDGAACLALAQAAEAGGSAPKDPARAADLYRKACSAGSASGCTQLGVMHNLGFGVAQDFAGAALHYERGCTLGDMAGCNNLGTLYQFGSVGFRDPAKAAKLYEQACAKGHMEACANLGLLYMQEPLATRQQKGRARELLQKACSAGVSRACGKIGSAPSIDESS